MSWGTTIHMVVAQVQSTQRGHAHEARQTPKNKRTLHRLWLSLICLKWYTAEEHLSMFFGWFWYDHGPYYTSWLISGRQCHLGASSERVTRLGLLRSLWATWINLSHTLYIFSAVGVLLSTFSPRICEPYYFWRFSLNFLASSFLMVKNWRLDCAKEASWQGAVSMMKLMLGCLVIIAISIPSSYLCCGGLLGTIHKYLQIIWLISFVPARCRRSLASHREWLHESFPKLTVFRTQCFPPRLAVFAFPHPRRFQSRV